MCVTLLSPFNTPIASIYLNHTQTEKKQYAFTTLTMQIVSVMNVTDKENAFAHTHTESTVLLLLLVSGAWLRVSSGQSLHSTIT